MPASLTFTLLLALAPAMVTWWLDRRLARRTDDPALPELLLAQQQRLARISSGGLILLVVFFGEQWYWAVPLLLIALLASRYPLRRSLFAERWSIAAYLRYGIFSVIGGIGPWLLMAFMSAIVLAIVHAALPGDDPRRAAQLAGVIGAIFAAVLLAWQQAYARIWLALHRATPLAQTGSPQLIARLEEVLDRAQPTLHRRPAVYRYGVPGAHIMNAAAIPSLGAPAVALGDTLLATLSEDEIVAVFAHEVAHHEQFNARRLRRTRWLTLGIVALAAALPPFTLLTLPATATLLAWVTSLGIILALGRRAARSRADETASDRRAVELTGNASALATALRKLHVYSRIPRRWPHDFERAATHPSLARRIQAIEAQPSTTPTSATPVTVRSKTRGVVVTLDAARGHWFEGVPDDVPLDLASLRENAAAYRAVAYRDLTELRLVATGDERMLKATGRDGRSWTVTLRMTDVSAVQGMLDDVDVLLATPLRSRQGTSPIVARLLAAVLFVSLTLAGELGLLFVPIAILAFRPGRAAMLATGAMALARALVVAASSAGTQLHWVGAGLAAATGVVLLIFGVRAKHNDDSRPLGAEDEWRDTRLVIGGMLLVLLPPVAGLAPSLSSAPRALLDHPFTLSLAVAAIGLGMALSTLRSLSARATGAGLAACAACSLVLLTGDGWLYHRLPPIEWTERSARRVVGIPVDASAFQVELSPGAKYFVLRKTVASRHAEATTTFVIRKVGGDAADTAQRTIGGSGLLFLDDDRLLLLRTVGDSLELQVQRLLEGGGLRTDTLWLDASALWTTRSFSLTGRAERGPWSEERRTGRGGP